MNASIIAASPTPIASRAQSAPLGVPANRRTGAMAGAMVAVAATVIAMFFGAPYLALGIPAATVAGFWLGPQVRSPGPIAGISVGMGALTVTLADAMLILGAGVVSLSQSGPYGGAGLAGAIAGGFALFVMGLVVVGTPMLLVTIPCGLIWAVIVRWATPSETES